MHKHLIAFFSVRVEHDVVLLTLFPKAVSCHASFSPSCHPMNSCPNHMLRFNPLPHEPPHHHPPLGPPCPSLHFFHFTRFAILHLPVSHSWSLLALNSPCATHRTFQFSYVLFVLLDISSAFKFVCVFLLVVEEPVKTLLKTRLCSFPTVSVFVHPGSVKTRSACWSRGFVLLWETSNSGWSMPKSAPPNASMSLKLSPKHPPLCRKSK